MMRVSEEHDEENRKEYECVKIVPSNFSSHTSEYRVSVGFIEIEPSSLALIELLADLIS